MPRAKTTSVHLTRPTGKPMLMDRWTCSRCQKLRSVAAVDGEPVLADHLVFVRDETHPRGGEHQKCPGSRKPGEGRIIHNAVMDSGF
jgi:hypothetical protein